MDNILANLNQTLFPGHQVIRVNGWEAAEKYPMPRDCEVIMLDQDPESNYIYMKRTDSNGGPTTARYRIIEEPIPRFDPDKYISVEEFKSYREENSKFQEDILDAINSLKQSITNSGSTKSNGYSK